jgi:hypothetical protein
MTNTNLSLSKKDLILLSRLFQIEIINKKINSLEEKELISHYYQILNNLGYGHINFKGSVGYAELPGRFTLYILNTKKDKDYYIKIVRTGFIFFQGFLSLLDIKNLNLFRLNEQV